jgi:hypothetical protein
LELWVLNGSNGSNGSMAQLYLALSCYIMLCCFYVSNAGKPSSQSSSIAPWTEPEPWRHGVTGKTSAAEVTGQAKLEAAESVESPVRHGSPCGFFGENVGKL